MTGIYKIESKIKPNRIYIGSAVDITHRWETHLSDLKFNKHHSVKLQRHYNKYGKTDLQFSILLGCEKEYLIANEQFFLDSYKPYFNICKTAGSQLGLKRSEETKREMSKNRKGKTFSDEFKKKLSKAQKGHKGYWLGKKLSEEHRANLSRAKMGHKNYYYGKKQNKIIV